MKPSRLSSLTAMAWMTVGMVWLLHGPVQAQPGDSHAITPASEQATFRTAAANTDAMGLAVAPLWHELTPDQKKVLAPLAQQWPTLDETSRGKWLRVANRFERMSPEKQARVQARMHHWAQLTPQQRGEARLRFQQTRQLSRAERERKWAEYQALSAEDRQDLTRQAERKAKPVFLSNQEIGPREARQAYTAGRPGEVGRLGQVGNHAAQKSNVVPDAVPGVASTRTVVSPTSVSADKGATTHLLNQRPTPPLHQQAGLPKIAATEGFVDPVTLLPRKGAQGAAMTPQQSPKPLRPPASGK